MSKNTVLVLSSALLLCIAYAWPAYWCWLVFIFLIPLFAVNHSVGFKEGLLWGLVFYSLHLYPIAQILYEYAQDDYRMLLYPLLIIYLAIYSGIWFFLVRIVRKYCRALAWPVVTFCYFVWMQCAAFWIFDVREGYPFALPIIPLAQYAEIVRLLPWCGVYGLTALLIWSQWLIVAYVYNKKSGYALSAFCCYTVFFIGFFVPMQEQPLPNFAKKLVYISPSHFDEECFMHPLDCAQEIAYALQEGVTQYPEAICFVLPESAFPFVAYSHIYELWQSVVDDNNHELIVGLHKEYGCIIKNCFSHLKSCRIIQTYEKTHATCFTERTPFHLKGFKFFSHLFGGNTDRSQNNFSYIKGVHHKWSPLIRIFNYPFFPVLCSKLFFNDFLPLPFNKVPILLLCNDNWFTTNQMKRLMFLYAKIYTLRWNRPIIYVSHSIGTLISQTGRSTTLSTIA